MRLAALCVHDCTAWYKTLWFYGYVCVSFNQSLPVSLGLTSPSAPPLFLRSQV